MPREPEPNPSRMAAAEFMTEHEMAAITKAGEAWSAVAPARAEAGAIDPDLQLRTEARGSLPGNRYVRIKPSKRLGFHQVAPGWIQADPRATAPKSGPGRLLRQARTTILGAPLQTRQYAHERLTKVKALAVLSSDALSSVAYATEQILVVLVAAGAAAYAFTLPIMIAILILLGVVVFSYRQTIKAYPKGGGSYIVAKDNLGPVAGLVAASALMTDYVLTVAVSVASGVDAVVSALPGAAAHRIELSIGMVMIIVLGNLRGIRESGSIFAAPTYLFIGGMFAMLVVFGFRFATGTLPQGQPQLQPVTEQVGIFLVLRAFASGCTALTGVEAISDGVPAFKPPEWRNARLTLTIMGGILGLMFLGITLFTLRLGLAPKASETIISQLAHHAFGGSFGYLFVIATTTAILVLAANTSFSDFPRLFYFLARDDYAPHQFKRLGERLAFSNGIVVLAVLASVLLIVFRTTEKLIPLYTVGVFLAFTMSQAGMVARWWRRREPGWMHGLPINFLGMTMTAVVFLITASSKFLEGAWVVVLVIPTLVLIFRAIHRHYTEVAALVATEIPTSPSALKPICIVPVSDLNGIALQSLAMARSLSDSVIAVHLSDDEEAIARLRAKWELWGKHVPLEIVESPYRSFVGPLLAYIDAIDRQRQGHTLIVVLPELVATRWWHNLLHQQTALWLKANLLFRPGTVVVNVPYHLRGSARISVRSRRRQPR